MDYFNAGGGGSTGNGNTDPYAVIPQQFGNGGQQQQQPQQQMYFQYSDYQQEGVADYDAYQQQQQQQAQYRATQASQQSPSVYYQNQMTAAPGSYFPIHSASEHDYLTDFLGPQQPPTGAAASTGSTAAAPYQGRSGSNKEFMIQHQQRRGNQSGQQQNQQSQQSSQHQQNQTGRQQNQQQMQQQAAQPSHYMQQQLQAAAQQQQAQQMHQRLHSAQINPQQFMVPPPAMMQPQQMQQQQQVHQMHQLQMQQQQHSQMVQHQPQQGYHPHQQNQPHVGGHQHHQNQNQHHHNLNHPGQHAIPQNPMLSRAVFKIRDWPIRCVVEGKYQSAIIGLHGSTIREIAQFTHCRVEFINLTKKERSVLGNNERILTIHGNADQASKAISRVLEVIQSEALKEDVNVGADIVLRLRAHNQLCGRLIGKAGASIKEIMQKTGTNITVTKFIEPAGGLSSVRPEEMLLILERTIMVRGPSIEAVVQAESLISAKLKKCYESDATNRGHNISPAMPMMMPQISQQGVSPSSAVQGPQIIPTPVGLVQVQHFPRSQHHLQGNANNSFLQPGVIQIAPGISNLRQVRMWVPDSMIGALIGAKGKNIKMIIRETGAAVKIEGPEEKAQREAEEEEESKKRANEADADERDGAASGDQPQEFLEDNGTVTSSDAIEEKPKPISERMVTINGDDFQLLKAQSYVFTKIAETSSSLPVHSADMERGHLLKIRTEVSVPTRIIGRIIGKGGQNVRELQRITGAVVKIPEEMRNGGEVHKHADGIDEEVTMIRTFGNMYSTHNVQFRLAHLVGEYYRSGEHRQRQSDRRAGRPLSATQEKDGSGLDKMDSLGKVPPLSNNSNRASPRSGSSSKSKSP